jgi:ERCC4-type nuclease
MSDSRVSTIAKEIACPFSIVVDTREQRPYAFDSIYAGTSHRRSRVLVPTVRHAIPVGDYSIFGMPQVVIERKSKEDLYGSVGRRENFVGRLERMSDLAFALVVVEADYLDLIRNPPAFSKLRPRSLSRTLIAWSIRYPVRWQFIGGRAAAEQLTFRYLERFYLDHRQTGIQTDQGQPTQDQSIIDVTDTNASIAG